MTSRIKQLGILALAAAMLALWWAPAIVAGESGRGSHLVCIDPGHGGEDPGAVANGVQEKDVNLDISLRTRPLLEAMGYDVLMTRTTDVYLSLQERCDIANHAESTVFVSIHNNSFMSTSEGTETYCYYDSQQGRQLATCIHEEVVRRINLYDRGVKEAGFYVLKHTDMPAALLEGAFVSNPYEAILLQDPAFRQKIAEGVAAGINDFLTGYPLRDEGCFEEYVLMMNPDSEQAAEVELLFMRCDGVTQVLNETIPPKSRKTVRVDDHVKSNDTSTLVMSKNGVQIIAERAMYFDFGLGSGGHGAPGVREPSCEWYLAEGCTDWGYCTYVLVQNPFENANEVTFDLMRSDGYVGSYKQAMEPHSRMTLDTSCIPGFDSTDFSVRVQSDSPVVVERAMYFNGHKDFKGGHVSPAVLNPSRYWYLAEAHTGDGFDTFILVANPNDHEVGYSVVYMRSDGSTSRESYHLPANGRGTIHLNEVPGFECADVSVRIIAERDVVVERSMYFDYNGIVEGSNSVGASSPSKTWYLAEGYTGVGFDTYILISNPGDVDCTAFLDFFLQEGNTRTIGLAVPARSRRTIKANDLDGMSGVEFSTHVTCDQPIVVERSMYFSIGTRSGGHSSIGVRAPSDRWYFAEGCTR